MSADDRIQVRTLVPGIDLGVSHNEYGDIVAMLFAVSPADDRRCCLEHICCSVADGGEGIRVTTSTTGMVTLWVKSTAFDLPFLELLKIADFLRLDIPLPHPPEGTLVQS